MRTGFVAHFERKVVEGTGTLSPEISAALMSVTSLSPPRARAVGSQSLPEPPRGSAWKSIGRARASIHSLIDRHAGPRRTPP
jgi:hypothetical protein